ncbi:hypothetical protein [Streptomyces sp. XH2]|uniref:hypothetical protein n=1 Tax=Streptomyces sp. XH2 TaxID=3412483 RepID=UPI003C7973CD
MTTTTDGLTVSEDDACQSGLCAESEDCTACDGSGEDPDGYGKCWTCDGEGMITPEHCCACGGSPYCNCCRACGAECIGSCTCPVTVTLADGTTKTLPPADEEDHEEPDFRDDEPDPEPPDGYYDRAPEPVSGYSTEPPF